MVHDKLADRVIEQLERRGFSPKSAGSGQWRSRCPVHNGESANLSIREVSDGGVLLYCHHIDEFGRNTCTFPDIMSALGLTKKDLFVPLANRAPKRKQQPEVKHLPMMGRGKPTAEAAIAGIIGQLGEPTAFWIYQELHDGQRFEVMRVYRFDLPDGSKTFRPLHPSSEGWRLGDPPGKWPIYNLPELASAETVVIVEGEKCCDLVRTVGLVATTSPHGSSSAAKADWSALAGKSVVIIPDNDDPGEGYAQTVAAILYGLDPRPTVRILRLPLREKGDDFEEWLRDSVPEQWELVDCRIEIERLAKRVTPWSPPPGGAVPAIVSAEKDDAPPSLTEWGNARRLVSACADRIRYCYSTGKWLIWNGSQWAEDQSEEIMRMTKEMIRQLPREAIESVDSSHRESVLKWALRSQQKRVMSSSVDLACSEPGIGVNIDDFDADPFLLNCPNGVIDLRTGLLRKQEPGDLLSRITSVPCDTRANCPRWRKTVLEIFGGDRKLAAYFRRAQGYSLTGVNVEHALFFCYGGGRTGKNTLLEPIKRVLGTYATVVDPRIFLSAGQNDHPTAIADLAGRRFVLTSEVDKSEKLAENLVKRITGDSEMKGRFMNKNFFTFKVQFAVWMLANYRPEITGQDEGIWGRIRVLPFDVFFPESKRIKGLGDILYEEEGPGILGWLVKGCSRWKRLGLREPARVKEAAASYRSEMDVIGLFLSQCTRSLSDDHPQRLDVRVKANALYARYASWCEESGEHDTMTSRKFGSEMSRRGFPLRGTNGSQWRHGLSLCDDEKEPYVDSRAH